MDIKKTLPCVLLVDDDDVTNFLNTKVIEHTATAAHIEVKLNGQEALDYLIDRDKSKEDHSPCLVLLDINMPVMDGWEFLQAYQHEIEDQKNYIVLLTASVNPDDIIKSKSFTQVNEFKCKPLTSEIMGEIIDNYFEKYLS
jgi:CheY-like chemotaxis protein